MDKNGDTDGMNESGSNQVKNNFCFFWLSKSPGFFLALSLRKNGNMKVFYGSKKDEKALINREKFFKEIGAPGEKVVSVKSVHGDNIVIVTEKDCGKFIDGTDGLITGCRDVYLSITIADCLPVIIFSIEKPAISLLHCGWKGLEKGIIGKSVLRIKHSFNIDPDNLYAGIGPGIGKCHYEVGVDFQEKFMAYPDAFLQRRGRIFADIKSIAQKQLEDAGVKLENIDTSPVCTYCEADRYFSHRKDKSEPVKAMIAVAGIRCDSTC